MCIDPITMGLTAAAIVGGGSFLTGATAGASLLAAGFAGLQAYSGAKGAEATEDAAALQAAGYFQSSEELMKQIKVIEGQSMVEEAMRREEYEDLTAKNLASAAASGADINSPSFKAVFADNEDDYTGDMRIAEMNKVNAKAQVAGQAQEYIRAGVASIASGKDQAAIQILNTGVSLLQNAPPIGLPSFSDNPNNITSGSVMASSMRPPTGRVIGYA